MTGISVLIAVGITILELKSDTYNFVRDSNKNYHHMFS